MTCATLFPLEGGHSVHLILVMALILGVGIGLQCVATALRMPALPLYLLAGVLLGPVFGLLDPDKEFGEVLRPVVSIAVAVVLFEGGLLLRFKEARLIGPALWGLIIAGLVVGSAITAFCAWYVFGMTGGTASVLGAILVVTGPTVILPMLRRARLASRPAALLKWEGIVNDPLGVLLAVFVFQVALALPSPETDLVQLSIDVGLSAVIAVVLGAGSAIGLSFLLQSVRLTSAVHSPMILAAVVVVFAGSEWFGEETGMLAVTVMGMVLGNLPNVDIHDIKHFKTQICTILVSTLFVVLAARLELDALTPLLGWPLLLVLVIVFVVRPVVVMAGTFGTRLTGKERAMLSWVAPRGIVAAAVAGAFEPRLLEAGFADANLLVPIVFGVIAVTVVLQGFSIRPVARFLGLGSPDGAGVMIVGVREFTIALGLALQRVGVEVHLADTVYRRVSKARRAGLEAHYEDVLADDAALDLPFERISWVLVATDDDTFNTVVSMGLTSQFGASSILQLTPTPGSGAPDLTEALPSRTPWRDRGTYKSLAKAYWRAGEVRTTQLTPEYTAADFRAKDPEALPLFVLRDGVLAPVEGDEIPETVTLIYIPGPTSPGSSRSPAKKGEAGSR